MSDTDVSDIMIAVRRRVAMVVAAHHPWPKQRRVTLFVAAGVNHLTDSGVAELMSGLVALRSTVQVRVLRLHMNRLGDGAARAVAGLLSSSTHPVSELHLSHNHISIAGP